MDRKTYIETVLSALRHVTQREREAIRAEIDGHIEDHMADLLELDYPPELAEERTLSAMGDPAEVGRELNKQYPLRWLTVCWIARLLSAWTILAVLLLLLSAGGAEASPLTAALERIDPDLSHHFDPSGTVVAEESLDIAFPVGNDVVRVLRICTYRDIPWGELRAFVNVDTYDRWPLGVVSDKTLLLESQNGGQEEIRVSGLNRWWHLGDGSVRIQPGDTYVTLRYGGYGESGVIQIPLPEGGAR